MPRRALGACLSLLLLGATARRGLADPPVLISTSYFPHFTYDQPPHTDAVALPGGRFAFCSGSGKSAGVCDSTGTTLAVWTTSSDVNAYPSAIGMQPNGTLVVFDRNLKELEFFSQTGTLLSTQALSPDPWWYAMDVAPNGDIYVVTSNGHLQQIGANGGFIGGETVLDVTQDLYYAGTFDVTVLADGTLAVLSWMSLETRIDVFGSGGGIGGGSNIITVPRLGYQFSPAGTSGFLLLSEDIGTTGEEFASHMRLDGSIDWDITLGYSYSTPFVGVASAAADSTGHFYVLVPRTSEGGFEWYDMWHYQDVGAFMNSPIIPTGFNGAWTLSGAHCPGGVGWVDPPTATGYAYAMTGGTVCTAIDAFPTGFTGPFTVSVGNVVLGTFSAGQKVTFANYAAQLGGALVSGPGYSGVLGFTVSGVEPGVDPASPTAFPLRLRFAQETVSLTMTAQYTATAAGDPSGATAPGIFAHVAGGAVQFVLGAAAGSHERIDIFDVAGTAVAQITANGAAATWRGDAANGSRVSPGVYFARRADGSRTRFVFAPR